MTKETISITHMHRDRFTIGGWIQLDFPQRRLILPCAIVQQVKDIKIAQENSLQKRKDQNSKAFVNDFQQHPALKSIAISAKN